MLLDFIFLFDNKIDHSIYISEFSAFILTICLRDIGVTPAMRILLFVCTLAVSTFFNVHSVFAAGTRGFLGLSLGVYDVLDNEEAADLRAEYRPNVSFVFKRLKPWAGIEVTSDASLWAGGGFLFDINLGKRFVLTPSIGAGYYAPGHSDKDLGYPLMFRSQLELAYAFDSGCRLGVSFSHLSNASLGSDNPGTESFNVYYHVPLSRLFGGKGA